MIVIGVDVHKHSLTAVAVDEVGRSLVGRSAASETARPFQMGELRLGV
jgi:hypothetical protein